jgi:hypothetical protein
MQFGVGVPDSGSLSGLENVTTAAQASRHAMWSSDMRRRHTSPGACKAIAVEKLAGPLDASPVTGIACLSSYQLTEWVTL